MHNMALHFRLALLAAVWLNGAVLGDDSTSGGALAGADGERNAPSRGGDAGRKSEARARNGDKLVVLDSARTTPSETVRKSVSVVKRVSGQSSLHDRNEAGNDHVGVGSELHDQPATSHKAQASVGDKHGMKLPHARRPAVSRHSEGGLTSKNPKESAEVLDHKKEFENVVSGIIAEEAYPGKYDYYTERGFGGNYDDYGQYNPSAGNSQSDDGVQHGVGSSEQKNTSTSDSVPATVSRNDENIYQPVKPSSSVTGTAADSGQGSVKGNKDKVHTEESKTPKNLQQKKEKENEEKEKEEDGNEKEEKQLEQESNENNDGRETNNSSEDTENKKAPSSGNSAFLCGSYSSVLLVALVCLCACAC
ncbi:hypothetical protein TRVL_07609 [Trypanosoma vivax]|nr:hypothetical protein TRVL_07609 [Trypanosoma vivax]